MSDKLKETDEQPAPVKENDDAADDIDDPQHPDIKPSAEHGDHKGQSCKPQTGGRPHTADKGDGLGRRQRHPEGSQHHGPVHDGLGIEPGHNTGGIDCFPKGHSLPGAVYILCLCPQQTCPYENDDNAPRQQNDHLQPSPPLHHRADAEKAGQRQRHIKEDDNKRCRQGAAARVGQSPVDDKKILQPYGRHVGKSYGQPLKKKSHSRLLSFPVSLHGQ